MGCMRFGVPDELARILIHQFAPPYFVETGTYKGDTASWAAGLFEHVITIEGSASFYEKTSPALARFPNVEFILGDSKEILPQVIPTLTGPAMFWLDSHWMGEDSFGWQDECPLLAELDAINAFPCEQFILIDDACLFLAPPDFSYNIQHWPTIDQVFEKLKVGPKRYIVVWEDVIVAVPERAREVVSSFCRMSRTSQMRQVSELKSFHPDTSSVHVGMAIAQDGLRIAMRGVAQKVSRIVAPNL